MASEASDTAAELEHLIDEAWAPVPLHLKARFMMAHPDGLDPVRLALRERNALLAEVAKKDAEIAKLRAAIDPRGKLDDLTNVVALAEAHRQDSEDADEREAALTAAREQVTALQAENARLEMALSVALEFRHEHAWCQKT